MPLLSSASSLILEPSDFAPHPKRKYTVTERVLAANRANLVLANAVPREIRFRSTDRRKQACRHNLQLAVLAKKHDRSLTYATSFRHGWYVADPERALALVGATPEEYHRHLEAWRREIAPRDATEEKLAHALGMLSWRWIAGVRLEHELETLRVCRALEWLAAARRGSTATPGCALEMGSTATLGCALEMGSTATPGCALEMGSTATPGCALEMGSTATLGCALEMGSTATPGCAPDAGPFALPLTAEQLSYLGYLVDDALCGCVGLDVPLKRISGRMLRLWQELLKGRGEPLLELKTLGCRGHRQVVVIDHSMHSPYELAEPFGSCRRTQAAVCPDPRDVPPVEQWAGRGQSEVDSRESRVESPESTVDRQQPIAESRETECDDRGTAASTAAGADEPYRTGKGFRHGIYRSDLPLLLEARRLGWESPGNFDGFLRLVQAAIGSPGSAGLWPAPSSGAAANPAADSGAGRAARRWERRVRLFARAVWKALCGLRHHADELLEFLNRRLGDYATSLWPEWWPRSFYWGVRSAHRSIVALGSGTLEGRMFSRGEDLADFHFELRIKFGREMYGRLERCQAAIAVVRRE